MSNSSDSSPLDLAAWPSVLALPLRDYQREQQPVLKLWLMCDVVELTLRLAAVVGVAELRARHGQLPPELRASLAGQIHRPTTGQWKSIVQQIIHYLPYAALINGPGCTSFRGARRRAVGGDGIAGRVSGTKTGCDERVTVGYWLAVVRTSFQSWRGGRRRWIDRWRVSIWRLAVSPGSSASKPQ